MKDPLFDAMTKANDPPGTYLGLKKLLKSWLKTKEEWQSYVGRGIVVVEDGDEIKT